MTIRRSRLGSPPPFRDDFPGAGQGSLSCCVRILITKWVIWATRLGRPPFKDNPEPGGRGKGRRYERLYRPPDGPSNRPTVQPTVGPSHRPAVQLTVRPSDHPTRRPTDRPTQHPTVRPMVRTADFLSHCPTIRTSDELDHPTIRRHDHLSIIRPSD